MNSIRVYLVIYNLFISSKPPFHLTLIGFSLGHEHDT